MPCRGAMPTPSRVIKLQRGRESSRNELLTRLPSQCFQPYGSDPAAPQSFQTGPFPYLTVSSPLLSSPPSLCADPYDSDPAASAAIAATMDKLDWSALLRRVDEGFCSWRQPSLLLFGTSGQCRGCCARPWVLNSPAVRGGAASGRRHHSLRSRRLPCHRLG